MTIIAGYGTTNHPQDDERTALPAKGCFRRLRRIIESQANASADAPARMHEAAESDEVIKTLEPADTEEIARQHRAQEAVASGGEGVCDRCQSGTPGPCVAAELRELRELMEHQAAASEERDRQTQSELRASLAALSVIREEDISIREEELRVKVALLNEVGVITGLLRRYQPQYPQGSPPSSVQSIEDRTTEPDQRQARQKADADQDDGNERREKSGQAEHDEQKKAGKKPAEQKEGDLGNARREDGKHRRDDSFDSADFSDTANVDDFV